MVKKPNWEALKNVRILVEGLRANGLSNQGIGELIERAGKGELTENDLFFLEKATTAEKEASYEIEMQRERMPKTPYF